MPGKAHYPEYVTSLARLAQSNRCFNFTSVLEGGISPLSTRARVRVRVDALLGLLDGNNAAPFKLILFGGVPLSHDFFAHRREFPYDKSDTSVIALIFEIEVCPVWISNNWSSSFICRFIA